MKNKSNQKKQSPPVTKTGGNISPTKMNDKVYTVNEQMKSKICKPIQYIIDEKKGCHLCISHTQDTPGYTYLKRNGKSQGTHCYLYKITKGEIKKGNVIMHMCNTPQCINPEHLEQGTRQDDTNHKVLSGRHCYGEKHPRAKLTEEQVMMIRSSEEKGVKLGKELGYDSSAISKIRKNKRWKHLLAKDKPAIQLNSKPKSRIKSNV